jgi:hypothetical protein
MTKPHIHLDVCALCRPFDKQTQARIKAETEAVILLLEQVRLERYNLIVSPAHHLEINAISDAEKHSQLTMLLSSLGTNFYAEHNIVYSKVKYLQSKSIKLADATHFVYLANAFFMSVDDRFLKLCHRLDTSIWFGNPISFCKNEGLL